MKKIQNIFTILILISLGISQSYAWYNGNEVKKIDTNNDYIETYIPTMEDEYYQQTKELKDNITKYYYAKFFKKSDEKELYSKIKMKFDKVKELNKKLKYPRKNLLLEKFMKNTNNREILKELKATNIKFDYRYNRESSFFKKNFKIDLSSLLKDNQELYIVSKINNINELKKNINKESKLGYYSENLSNIYFWEEIKDLKLEKINSDFNWNIEIDIKDYIKNFKQWDEYEINFTVFIKKGDNYVAIQYPRNVYFNFNKYAIENSFSNNYNQENSFIEFGPNIQDNLNKKLTEIFNKIKLNKTEKEYLSFLKKVKTKVSTFMNNKDKYEILYSSVVDEKSYNLAYIKYENIKDKEKIIQTLFLFVNEEIYNSQLEDTISEFIK